MLVMLGTRAVEDIDMFAHTGGKVDTADRTAVAINIGKRDSNKTLKNAGTIETKVGDRRANYCFVDLTVVVAY